MNPAAAALLGASLINALVAICASANMPRSKDAAGFIVTAIMLAGILLAVGLANL